MLLLALRRDMALVWALAPALALALVRALANVPGLPARWVVRSAVFVACRKRTLLSPTCVRDVSLRCAMPAVPKAGSTQCD